MASKKEKKITIAKPKDECTHLTISMNRLIYLGSAFSILVALMILFFINQGQAMSITKEERAELEFLRKSDNDQVAEIEKLAKDAYLLQSDIERVNSHDAELRLIMKKENTAAGVK